MAIAIHEEGTYTEVTPASGNTWDVIQTTSPNGTDGVFQIILGLNALAAGDTLEAKFEVEDSATGTLRTIWHSSWSGAQAETGWVSPPIACVNEWDFSMRQTAGTARAVKWSIVKVT